MKRSSFAKATKLSILIGFAVATTSLPTGAADTVGFWNFNN